MNYDSMSLKDLGDPGTVAYDLMTVEQLRCQYDKFLLQENWTKHSHFVEQLEVVHNLVNTIFAALCRAVIREASVGTGTVRRAGDEPLPDAPQMFVPWETKDGDYDLIPKETP